MIEIIHGGMLIPTSVSICCAVGARRADRAAGVVVGVAMLLAMADYTSGSPVVPAVGWAALLVLLALITSALASIRQRGSEVADGLAMATHRGLGLVLTAGLFLVGHPANSAMSRSLTSDGGAHAHGGSAIPLTAMVLVAAGAYLVFSVVAVRRGLHAGRPATPSRLVSRLRDGTVDVASMTTGTSVMALMVIFG